MLIHIMNSNCRLVCCLYLELLLQLLCTDVNFQQLHLLTQICIWITFLFLALLQHILYLFVCVLDKVLFCTLLESGAGRAQDASLPLGSQNAQSWVVCICFWHWKCVSLVYMGNRRRSSETDWVVEDTLLGVVSDRWEVSAQVLVISGGCVVAIVLLWILCSDWELSGEFVWLEFSIFQSVLAWGSLGIIMEHSVIM